MKSMHGIFLVDHRTVKQPNPGMIRNCRSGFTPRSERQIRGAFSDLYSTAPGRRRSARSRALLGCAQARLPTITITNLKTRPGRSFQTIGLRYESRGKPAPTVPNTFAGAV